MTRTYRFWLGAIVATIVAVLVTPFTAYASTGDGSGDEFLTLEAGTVRLLVAFVLPAIVGLITKAQWSSLLKGAILVALNGVAAAVVAATLVDGRAVWSEATLQETILQLAISVAAFVGILKPAGLFSGFQPNGTPGKLNTVGVH